MVEPGSSIDSERGGVTNGTTMTGDDEKLGMKRKECHYQTMTDAVFSSFSAASSSF